MHILLNRDSAKRSRWIEWRRRIAYAASLLILPNMIVLTALIATGRIDLGLDQLSDPYLASLPIMDQPYGEFFDEIPVFNPAIHWVEVENHRLTTSLMPGERRQILWYLGPTLTKSVYRNGKMLVRGWDADGNLVSCHDYSFAEVQRLREKLQSISVSVGDQSCSPERASLPARYSTAANR
jgi:hypothetical protein